MAILVYRDRHGTRDLVGNIERDPYGQGAAFSYEPAYLERAQAAGELGLSTLLPLDANPYASDVLGPFIMGLLPEGEILGNLATIYQVPRSDYLTLIERMGCECIGALTFVSEGADPSDYDPRYDRVTQETIDAIAADPARAATLAASDTRLSLAGAQSKVAWTLPFDIEIEKARLDDWLVPRGTAASTHIVKLSRKGEEDIAANELACSLLAKACGIDTVDIHELAGLPGAIAVRRYDRLWQSVAGRPTVVRLHQEDFCQALGLAPYYKYQPQGVDANYPVMATNLIQSISSNPRADGIEFAKRLVFCYAIGDSDAHLKNFSMLYDKDWRTQRLAPLYDVTCIPLTGYSTLMPFDIGNHRKLEDIDARDITMLASDLDVGLDAFDQAVGEVVDALRSPRLERLETHIETMVARTLENASPRLRVLEQFLG